MRGVPATRYLIFFLIAGLGCIADLATKNWIFAELGPPPGRTWWIWEEYFGFQTSLNPGALFGIGKGLVWLFAALSVAAGALILYWLFAAGAARSLLLTLALASVMAGILGNLYDRLGLYSMPGRPGVRTQEVRDWILFQYDDRWRWPNFNIADSLLVCGAVLLIWHAFRCGPDAPATQSS